MIAEFETLDGYRLAVKADQVEALVELGDGHCQIVTSSDTYRVKAEYADARARLWPDKLFP